MRRRHPEGGFILALSVLLVLFLSISGMSFLQLDSLERKMTLNNVDNHGAFYVTSAGIERAREVLKIPDTLSWSAVLAGTYDGPDAGGAVDYPLDPAPVFCPLCACGPAPAHNCVTMPFGAFVNLPDNFVSEGTFDDGQYTVRAFNNAGAGETSTVDNDQMLMVRALGTVRNDQKLLEARILAASNVNLINCDHVPCPDVTGNGGPQPWSAAPGREPAGLDSTKVGPDYLPKLDFKLTNTSNYYRQTGNFIGSGKLLGSTGTVRTSIPGSGAVQSNSYYNLTGNVTVKNTTASNVVIFTTGTISVDTGTNLTNVIIVGANGVDMKGSGTIRSPLPYPAIITEGAVTGGSGSKQIFGAVFAARPTESGKSGNGINGTVDVNPVQVHGVLIGNLVKLQGQGSTFVTDDYATDPNYTKYYALMPGFIYPQTLKTTVVVQGQWREIQ